MKHTKTYKSRKTYDDANLNPAYMSVKDNPTPEGTDFVCLTYHPRFKGVWRKYVEIKTVPSLVAGQPDKEVLVWTFIKLNPAS